MCDCLNPFWIQPRGLLICGRVVFQLVELECFIGSALHLIRVVLCAVPVTHPWLSNALLSVISLQFVITESDL